MSETHETLFHPTVADLIAELQKFPPTAFVQLIDNDKGWRVRKFKVGYTTSNGYVYIWSEYNDMDAE